VTAPAAHDRPARRWSIVLLQLVFVYLLALRLWFDLAVAPMGDEAYYWMWGQHLSWSYFDHPPLDGWLQGLVATVLPWSNFSVRALTWLSLAGTLWIVWLWSKRLSPDDRAGWFWHTAVIYLCIPVIFMMQTFALHDHLLLFFVVASAYCFHGFAAEWEDGRQDWRRLYLAAALLGLAVLTKYNGVFLGLGYAAWVLARPKLRPLLLTPHLWLAALLAIAIQAPVFYWNATEGLASFRFHLSERPSLNWARPRVGQVIDFLATMAIMMSPVLFLSLFRLPWLKARSGDESRAIGLGSAIYLISTLAWTAISAYIYVFFHWNIVAYAGLAPIAYRLLGNRIAWLHIAFGVVLITLGLVSYTITPTSILGYRDLGAAASYGWPDLAARVKAQQAAHPAAFLAAARYNFASQLGFELHETDIAAFNALPSQYDYWWNAATHRGRDAIIVADATPTANIAQAKGDFASVSKLEDVPVRDNLGNVVWTFEIWLGTNYQPPAN
jgi:4-amino-4-deoxy-L-arabinose transferase-like glycosyltransferase